MRRSFCIPFLLLVAISCIGTQAQTRQRLNPMIDLLEQKKPLFGVYWPGNPQGRRGGPPPADAVMKSPAEGAKEARAYRNADFLFNGSMEQGLALAMRRAAWSCYATARAR